MKIIIPFLTCVFLASAQALAAEGVVLDSGQAELPSNETVLVKTEQTPSRVKLRVPVPFTIQKCEEGFERQVSGYNGAECGYRLVSNGCRYPGGGGIDRNGRYHPPVCIPETREEPRYCSYTVCDRPYTETETVMKDFEIIFENYDREEEFSFSLDERGNVKLMPLRTSPGCTALTVYGERPYVNAAKISIKSGWFHRSCN